MFTTFLLEVRQSTAKFSLPEFQPSQRLLFTSFKPYTEF